MPDAAPDIKHPRHALWAHAQRGGGLPLRGPIDLHAPRRIRFCPPVSCDAGGAQRRGQLSAQDLGIDPDDPMHGARCICSPPPRNKANQQCIWNALASGLFTVFSSDHAPFNIHGADGKRVAGDDASFDRIPNGIPGVETRMPLLMSAGVLAGRIDIHRFVELTATNPARIYGLYPKKGTIAVGGDADLVVWDLFEPGHEKIIGNDMLHHAADYTPYEGMRLRAWPGITVSRGRVVWRDGVFSAEPGSGQFQPCLRPRTPNAGSPLDKWL